jgi:hypothetical protein
MTDDPLARQRARQVAHSLNVIAELPRYVDDTQFPVGLRVAAVDGFFVHMRLLIEFLVKPQDLKYPAIHRDDYTASFRLAQVDTGLYQQLLADYDFASKHVAHLSINRLPDVESGGVDFVSASRLRARAEDVFRAMTAFIRHLRATGSAYADDFDQHLSEAAARQS